MAIALVQSAISPNDGGSPVTAPTFGSTPTVGNLVVEMSIATNGVPGAINGWTLLNSATLSGTLAVGLFYRYVQSGDTVLLPESNSDNTGRQSSIAWEISGAGSTWASSYDNSQIENPTPGTTNSITTMTTGTANEIALVAGLGFYSSFFPPAPSIGSPFTQDKAGAFFETFDVGGDNTYASSGASVNVTITWGGVTPTNCGLLTILLKTPSSGATGTITTTLGGIAQSLSGNVVSGVGSITTTLGGLTQAAAGTVTLPHNYGPIVTSLSGFKQLASGVQLGAPGNTTYTTSWTIAP